MSDRVVTGMAIANCLGIDNDTVFDRAFKGGDAFSPADAYAELPFPAVLGIMPPIAANDLDCTPTRIANVAFASVRQLRPAVRAAVDRWGARRIAYVFASSTGGLECTERAIAPQPSLPSESYSYGDHLVDATSPAIARYLGIEGISLAISTACSSSFKALASAMRLIDSGLADAAVVGSADSLCRTTIFGFHSLGLLAPTATRPFSRDRAGITLGEGSAYILVERETDANRDEALARVSGIGAASDTFHHTSPHPDGTGPAICMRQALDRAGLSPNQIDYVSAHGTGTKQNDAAESAAVMRVFERTIPVTATKCLTGHTLGSAGITALVLAIESLRRGQIPATLRATPDEELAATVVTTLTPARVQHVLVNAFGFGGSNASVIISQARSR
ncbi:MAG TPA: beta-ketoacyl synthase N-terminal-like domain-containing protein [Kofleriaceae bacterium]|jgi:3-oxoacyl-[acyl-carrier-protein] synthase-1